MWLLSGVHTVVHGQSAFLNEALAAALPPTREGALVSVNAGMLCLSRFAVNIVSKPSREVSFSHPDQIRTAREGFRAALPGADVRACVDTMIIVHQL